MLIKYEYELLSTLALDGIKKVDGNLIVPFTRIDDDIRAELSDEYLQNLKLKNLIILESDKLVIKIDSWIDFFMESLVNAFRSCNFELTYEKKRRKREFFVDITINGATKEFRIVYNELYLEKENTIFLCRPNLYNDCLYWIELLNNKNLMYQFYYYLVNEANFINKNVYMEFNIFDGIDEKYVVEIFNNSIKNYFKDKYNYEIENFDKEEEYFIKNLFYKDEISLYSVLIDKIKLFVVQKGKKIIFVTSKDKQLVYSVECKKIIDELYEKVNEKVSLFKKLTLFKDYNSLNSNIKILEKLSLLFVPTSTVLGIGALFNIKLNLNNILAKYKFIAFIVVLGLLIVQGYLLYYTFVPTFKISRFNWKLK